MPLRAGRSRKVISANIREMVAAGHPHDQAVAASLRTAGIKRKGGPMAKHEGFKHPHGGDKPYGHESGMAGEHGMSPRKAMASGKIGGGNFGAESYDEVHGGTGHHPDHTAHTGMRDAMEDHERATPPGIHHTKGHLPAQAAPRHGPHMDGWDREPKA